MQDWINARWTQARQIIEFTDPRAARSIPADVALASYFAELRARGDDEAAAAFVALALPRYDGIAWAHAILSAAPAEENAALAIRAAVAEWLEDPSDARRRAIWGMADAAPPESAERLLAHALYFSGGSIAPANLPAVLPGEDLSARLAAAAVIVACHAGGAPDQALRDALAAGETMARKPRL